MKATMNAIGFKTSLLIGHADSLIAFETDKPTASGHDLLVRVNAISINPADAKIRIRSAQHTVNETPRVLGYDAVGIVEAVGENTRYFKPGDRVFYAGDVTRSGSNAEVQLVDERIVGPAPKTLDDDQAAVLPLTALTAWEMIFDRLKIVENTGGKTLLIIGGAGGVGSIAIQIARARTDLTVIATASRPETQAWCRKMGADHVANHHDLARSVKELGFETVDYIFNTADTPGHWDAMAELIAPQGIIGAIVEFDGHVDLTKLQGKSAGFVWELMFTRSLFKTPDIARQHDILTKVSELVDQGILKTTLSDTISGFSVESLKEAHRRIESGSTIGKIAIDF